MKVNSLICTMLLALGLAVPTMGQNDASVNPKNTVMPQFRSGEYTDFTAWVAAHVEYPTDCQGSGNVIVVFDIDENGNVVNAKVLESEKECFNEAALKVVKSSPKWTPGSIDGKPAKVNFMLPVKFENYNSDEALWVCEKMPEFPGGYNNLLAYMSDNIKYPKEAKDKGICGLVFVSFVIEKDGSVSNIKVMRGVDKQLDDETIRVVKTMPKWTPGMKEGKPVRVSYCLPVNFTLSKQADKK